MKRTLRGRPYSTSEHNEMDAREGRGEFLLGVKNVHKRDTIGGNVLETHKFVIEI